MMGSSKRKITAIALAAGLAASVGSARAEGELKIYNWFDYMPQELLDKFSQEYDVAVSMDTYDSNETLLAKLKSGVTGFDVAVPGDYMVAIMIKEGLLERVEPNTFDNFGNVNADWVDVYFDEGRHYSIPYQWGTTSFMVNAEDYDGDIDTLAIVFDPPAELSGRINMFRDVNDVLNMGLRYLGYPRCNSDPEQLKALSELLNGSKKHWLSFNSDGAKEALVSGDAAVGMIWNGMGMRARTERPALKYAYPREGFTGWMDNLVVLKDAPNLENAKLFLNFMMRPENAAALSNFARYASGVDGTEPFLDQELLAAYEINIPEEAPAPEFVPPCDPKVVRIYDRIWTDLLK
jgi:spermidine/putrescine transport system substrate-binding protein